MLWLTNNSVTHALGNIHVITYLWRCAVNECLSILYRCIMFCVSPVCHVTRGLTLARWLRKTATFSAKVFDVTVANNAVLNLNSETFLWQSFAQVFLVQVTWHTWQLKHKSCELKWQTSGDNQFFFYHSVLIQQMCIIHNISIDHLILKNLSSDHISTLDLSIYQQCYVLD